MSKNKVLKEPVKPTSPQGNSLMKSINAVAIIAGILLLCIFFATTELAYLGDEDILKIILAVFGVFLIVMGIIQTVKEAKANKLCKHEYEESLAKYNKQLEEYHKQLTAEEQKKENRIASIKDGTYAFPSKTFYENCKKAGIESLDSEYSLAKATRIMEALLPGVEKSDCAYYTSRVKEYFEKGLRKYNEYWESAHEGSLSENEKQIYTQNSQYVKCIGLEKRKKILSDAIALLENKINILRKGEEAAFEAGVTAFKSYDTTPSGKWAYIGGAASAIGGPALGILVGASEMQKDIKKKELNSKAAYSSLDSMYDLSLKNGVEADNLEKEQSRIKKELQEVDNKIVLQNVDTKALFESLSLDLVSAACKLSKDSYTVMSVSITNNYKGFNEKEASNLVVDGYIKADLFWGDILIDSFEIALPCYGVGFSEEITVTAYSPKYIDFAGRSASFRTVFSNGALWVMEK